MTSPLPTTQEGIVRTERGLVLAGTRITLYAIMDYLKADWPPQLIQHWLNISERQLTDAINYIATHRDSVEVEYQYVLQQAEENRRYWEERNREQLEQIAKLPPKPGFEAAYDRLQARKAARDAGS